MGDSFLLEGSQETQTGDGKWQARDQIGISLKPSSPVQLEYMNLMEYALKAWCGSEKSRMFTFLAGEEVSVRSFEEEIAEAKMFAREYLRRGMKSGDVVILIMGFRVELVAAFLGAMWIGAVPSFMPESSEKQDLHYYWESHARLFERIGAKLLVTDQIVGGESITRLKNISTPVWNIDESGENTSKNSIESHASHEVCEILLEPSAPGAIAFLQHSSGTTALKKGVALTHRQVLAQLAGFQKAIGMKAGETVVSWLPLYHDMGLIACFILPMLCGAHVVMMSPFAWVRKPWMLLDAMETYRCDYCWLPNFAFNLLSVSSPTEKNWRLDSVKAFINCSEPCKADTFRRFAAAFASSGVRPEQLHVCYAMAETVFAATQTKLGERVNPLAIDGDEFVANHRVAPPKDGPALTFLPAGAAIEGMRVQIFDENRRPVAQEGIVGQIGVAGTSLFEGYYALPEETQGCRAGEWHMTGDLGFLHEGNLYVTGRKGDIIIVRGRKFHSFDIEHIVGGVAGIKPGRSVAFAVENEDSGSEDAVVVAELDANAAASPENGLRASVRKAVYDGLGLMLSDIHLAHERWIIKTTSGKVSRHLNAEKYKSMRCVHV